MLKRLEPTVRDLLLIEFAYGILAEGIGMAVAHNRLAYSLGILVGYLLVIFQVCHMYVSLEKALSLDPKSATKYNTSRSIFRYIIIVAVVMLSGALPQISVISVMVMLFGLKISAHLQPRLQGLMAKIFKEGR